MDYMLANPTATQGEIAAAFRLSQSWLSIIMHSEAFKLRYAEKSQETFDTVVIPLREKLLGVAHRAVEKLGQAVDNSQDPDFILDAANKTLQRLNYGQGPAAPVAPTNQQNNFFMVSPQDLAAARASMDRLREVTPSAEARALEAPREEEFSEYVTPPEGYEIPQPKAVEEQENVLRFSEELPTGN